MSKLVILNQGMTGRTFELNIERTTVGRVEDNTFQIADGSVSSHHAEIILRGSDILIRDLGSTNGTFPVFLVVADRSRDLSQQGAMIGGRGSKRRTHLRQQDFMIMVPFHAATWSITPSAAP